MQLIRRRLYSLLKVIPSAHESQSGAWNASPNLPDPSHQQLALALNSYTNNHWIQSSKQKLISYALLEKNADPIFQEIQQELNTKFPDQVQSGMNLVAFANLLADILEVKSQVDNVVKPCSTVIFTKYAPVLIEFLKNARCSNNSLCFLDFEALFRISMNWIEACNPMGVKLFQSVLAVFVVPSMREPYRHLEVKLCKDVKILEQVFTSPEFDDLSAVKSFLKLNLCNLNVQSYANCYLTLFDCCMCALLKDTVCLESNDLEEFVDYAIELAKRFPFSKLDLFFLNRLLGEFVTNCRFKFDAKQMFRLIEMYQNNLSISMVARLAHRLQTNFEAQVSIKMLKIIEAKKIDIKASKSALKPSAAYWYTRYRVRACWSPSAFSTEHTSKSERTPSFGLFQALCQFTREFQSGYSEYSLLRYKDRNAYLKFNEEWTRELSERLFDDDSKNDQLVTDLRKNEGFIYDWVIGMLSWKHYDHVRKLIVENKDDFAISRVHLFRYVVRQLADADQVELSEKWPTCAIDVINWAIEKSFYSKEDGLDALAIYLAQIQRLDLIEPYIVAFLDENSPQYQYRGDLIAPNTLKHVLRKMIGKIAGMLPMVEIDWEEGFRTYCESIRNSTLSEEPVRNGGISPVSFLFWIHLLAQVHPETVDEKCINFNTALIPDDTNYQNRQVAGHKKKLLLSLERSGEQSSGNCDDSVLYKPFNEREYEFYQCIERESKEVRELFPTLMGVQSNVDGDRYLVLENLFPESEWPGPVLIADIKLGTRYHDFEADQAKRLKMETLAKLPVVQALAFRITGLVEFPSGRVLCTKEMGKFVPDGDKAQERLEETLWAPLFSGGGLEVARQLLDILHRFRTVLTGKLKKFRFYSSSLLIGVMKKRQCEVDDGYYLIKVRLIDFAHSYGDMEEAGRRFSLLPGYSEQDDSRFMEGLENLIDSLQTFLN